MMIEFARKADDGGVGILFACIATVVFIVIALIRKASETSGSDASFSQDETRTVTPVPVAETQMVVGSAGPEPPPSLNETCEVKREPDVVVEMQQDPVGLRRQLPRQFVVLELKTTGSDIERDVIVEVGALLINQDRFKDMGENIDVPMVYSVAVNTGSAILENAKAYGFAWDTETKNEIELHEAITGVVEFVGDRPIAVYDTNFTMAFLFHAAEKCGVTIKNPYLGVMNMVQKAYPGLSCYDISHLGKMHKAPLGEPRTALDDCICVTSLLIASSNNINEKIPWKYYWKPARGRDVRRDNPGIIAISLEKFLPYEVVVLDVETTGLNSRSDEIIEIGAIRLFVEDVKDSLEFKFESFQTLVKPEKKISEKITEINGITQTMVDQEGISLQDALAQFLEFIGDSPLVAYNADFDMKFLYEAAIKCGVIIPNRYTCALKRARRAFPGLPSYKLAYIAKIKGLTDKDTHRVLGDCQRAADVFIDSVLTLGTKVRWTRPPESMSL